MNEFKEIFDQMGIDPAILHVLMGNNRSTIHKYLSGKVSAPASAIALIKLLHFTQVRNPESFKEWLVLNEMETSHDNYIKDPDLWKIQMDSLKKMKPSVRNYILKTK